MRYSMENKNEDNKKSANENSLTRYNKLGIPGKIIINKYTYTYKDQSKADKNKFFYRCNKTNCRVIIEITRENLNKIPSANKNEADEIIFQQKAEHKCEKDKYEKREELENCTTEEEMIEKANKIIIKNSLKPIAKLQNELHDENIFLSDDKVYRLIIKIRNSLYPKDDEALALIDNITITYDDKLPKSKNLPFCLVNNKFINPIKNRVEHYIIFSSKYNMTFLSKASYIFIDATFKVSPKNFFQLLNILVFIQDHNFVYPIMHVLMSNKSFISYQKILKDIKIFSDNYNINIDEKNIRFICDFEKSLIKSINTEFSKSKLNGCFFHYVKALWKKAKILGLTKFNLLKNTKIIIFGMKIYPFILQKNKEIFIKEIYDYANSIDNSYKNFTNYFKKNWEFSNFLNFDVITNGEIANRTNNYVESFHNKLNRIVEIPHPRIYILIEKLKLISIQYYYSYINNIFNDENNNNSSTNIYNDIYNFLETFLKKYNYNININLLLQDSGPTKNNYEAITKNILNQLFNKDNKIYEINSVDSENSNGINDSSEDNINNDLETNWWFQSVNDNNKSNNNNKTDEIGPFMIDNNLNYKKKRNYNSIENDIIEKLYNVTENNIKFNKIQKLY